MSQFTFPDNQYLPAETPQRILMPHVPFGICRELRHPKVKTRFRKPCESAGRITVTMPKASMNENHLAAISKDNVRLSWKGFSVEAVAIAQAMQKPPDRHFRFGVAALDAPHSNAALLSCQGVQF